MKIKEGMEQEYKATVEVNSHDGYSAGVIRYMERWADMMEEAIEDGATIQEVAESTSHMADTDGITGFMYGCAVNYLSQFWVHGEDLRVWHNRKYKYEGDGIVNPAILIIGGGNKSKLDQPDDVSPGMEMGQ